MNPIGSAADDDLLGRLLLALEAGGDRQAVIEQFRQQHPHLGEQIDSMLALAQVVGQGAPAPPDRLPEGTRLGPFEVVRYLTAGGMGAVYKAKQLDLNRTVALKVIRPDRTDEHTRARFEREREVLAALHQTHIVPVFAAGEENGLQYVAMHYIDGAALNQVVVSLRGRTLPADSTKRGLGGLVETLRTTAPPAPPGSNDPTVSESKGVAQAATPARPTEARAPATPEYLRSVAAVLADAADAVAAAHERGVHHRDVKPSNLMVEPNGKCWLIDFGLASPPPDGAAAVEGRDARLTQQWLGTPAYMAPEQFSRSGDPRLWDVWGLGATLYELLTLRPPHESALREAPTSDPPAPRTLDRSIPRDLDAICRKTLQRDPAARYPTAQAFGDDLRRWLNGYPTVARPAWTTLRPLRLWAWRNKAWAAAILVALLGLCVGFGAEVQRRRAAEREAAELQRGAVLNELTRLLLGVHDAGWSDRAERLIAEAREIRSDRDLNDHAAGYLVGLDARPFKHMPDQAATWLAYDASGQRLLIGGYTDRGDARLHAPTRVWKAATDTIEAVSTQSLPGPVAFQGDTPVQLVPPTPKRRSMLLWDVAKNRSRAEFPLPEGVNPGLPNIGVEVNQSHIALSADASYAALAVASGKNRSVLVWKAGDAKPCCKLEVDAEVLAFTPDGRLLAAGDDDGHVSVWSVPEGKRLAAFQEDRAGVSGLAFGRSLLTRSADRSRPGPGQGWLLAMGDASGIVYVWDLEAGTKRMTGRGRTLQVLALAFSADGTTLAATGRGVAHIWDVGTERLILNPRVQENWNPGIALTPSGDHLAVSAIPLFGQGKGVRVHALESGRGVRTCRGLNHLALRTRFSPDGKQFAALSENWKAGVWDAETGRLRRLVEVPKAMYATHADLLLLDNGRRLVVASGQEAREWDVATGRERGSWKLPPGNSSQLTYHAASSRVLLVRTELKSGTAYPNREVPPEDDPRVCPVRELLPDGQLKTIFTVTDYPIHAHDVMADPGGGYVVVDGLESRTKQSVSVYDSTTGKRSLLYTLPEPVQVSTCSLDTSGKLLIRAPREWEDAYLVMKMPGGERLDPISRRDVKSGLGALSPGMDFHCVVGEPGQGLRLFRTWEPTSLIAFGRDQEISHVRFAPVGARIAWGRPDGTFHICDVQEARQKLAAIGLGW